MSYLNGRGQRPWLQALFRHERRGFHFLNAAHIEVFRVAFFKKFKRDPVDTTSVSQTINTVAGLGDDDMSAVWQMPGDLFAVLWRCDRVQVAGKNQHRRV